MGACCVDAYMVCVGERFPVSERHKALKTFRSYIIAGDKMKGDEDVASPRRDSTLSQMAQVTLCEGYL